MQWSRSEKTEDREDLLIIPLDNKSSRQPCHCEAFNVHTLPYSEPIPGLFVFEKIITLGEEADLLHMLDFEDSLPWKFSRFNGISYGKRWGVHCNLRDRRVDSPQHPLPQAVQDFIQTKLTKVKETLKTKNAHLKDFQPNEANAIDYRRREKHWLMAHVDDRQLSKEPIANLSLAGDCVMTFRNQKRIPAQQQQQQQPEMVHRILLKRGTLMILTRKARYDYSHEIGNIDHHERIATDDGCSIYQDGNFCIEEANRALASLRLAVPSTQVSKKKIVKLDVYCYFFVLVTNQ
jgi:alkylated DNA repair dioxygenase AlkB